MKKILFTLALTTAMTLSQAQVLNVKSIERINTPEGELTAEVVGISPAGDYLLLSSTSKQGLVKYDLNGGATTTLTDAQGAGFGAQISADGNNVIFRERSINDDRLVYTAVKSIDIASKKQETLVAPSRDLHAMTFDGTTAVTVDGGRMKAKATRGGQAVPTRPVIANVNLLLELTVNGKTETFAPQGTDERYIWASISPDGNRVLYYVSGIGCFSCKLDRSDMRELGQLRAPKWLDNNTVVGMYDLDDGVFVTSSSIVVKTLDGAEQTLTDNNVIAMNPYCDANASKIVFSTPDGEAYIINIAK